MFGSGRGYRHWWPKIGAPEGYTYLGPCRCGIGPHAFYQDQKGRIVPGRDLYCRGFTPEPTKEDLKTELKALKQEEQELKKRIAELEKKDV